MALLSLLPKTEILATIVKINSLLQPMGYRTIDDSRKTQIECLKAILLQDEENAPEEYILRFKRYAEYLLSSSEFVSIFTRVTCLYALNEILQSDDFYNEEKSQYTFEERIPILDYLLICNERVLEFSENSTLEEIVDNKIDFFEFNAFNQVPHNQYYFNVNLLSKLYRSRYFLNVLLANEKTSHHLKKYFKVKFNISDIPEFYKVFFWSFMHMNDETLKTYYLNIPKDENGVLNVIRGFASSTVIDKVNHDDVRVLDFLVVKKNPVYEWEFYANDDFVGFLILDQKFLLDKIDGLFINDFWFDYLKEHSSMNRKDWGDFIGSQYFEPFVGEIVQKALGDRKDYSLKMFNELKLKYFRNLEIEIADIYVRHKQRIVLAEVKSNFINMIDGYKSITSIEDFKNLDLEKFYGSFGLKQLVEKTIKQFHNYKEHLKDDGLNLNRKVSLFPVIIVNEPILANGLFQFPLRRKFESMLKRENIKLKTKDHIIWPLLIINIDDLQELEESLRDRSVDFFDLLMSFHDKTRIVKNRRRKKNEYKELMSFSDIIDQKIDFKKLFPDRLREYEWVITQN